VVVERWAKQSIAAGKAFREIRDRKLWRAGGHANWNAYCESVQGVTRRYANMLISDANEVAAMAEVGNKVPTSADLQPCSRTQMIPLRRIKEVGLRNEAWRTAVERSGGQQPKGKTVAEVVAEALAEQDQPPAKPAPTPSKLTRAERRADVFDRLAAAIAAWDDKELATELLTELKDLL